MLPTMYTDYRERIVLGEVRILKELGFNIHVNHPYGLLVNYAKSLEIASNSKLCQIAWNYVNDSAKTIIPVCFQPNVIACAALYLAATECNVGLPTSPAWYEVFDCKLNDILHICATLIELKKKHADPLKMPWTTEELSDYVINGPESFGKSFKINDSIDEIKYEAPPPIQLYKTHREDQTSREYSDKKRYEKHEKMDSHKHDRDRSSKYDRRERRDDYYYDRHRERRNRSRSPRRENYSSKYY
ncbi:Cyclin C/H/T/L domain-containing protein [Rozella allomycis CSF55]|uniref:Cyclin C/H/T/L domain-containing protein n=1 Tax=Rozella allomycis (strain CSF55) TaxID=988480 RepID=A0A075AYZ6_ROZAC|nr:Cyclin C/H/T/L domain-containing protein [Rozella allomycis CSF55]|eukprot:EPZ35487.1 Cyclin C/H/T/L domain-containing protein [Rozella allomycis CSF55]